MAILQSVAVVVFGCQLCRVLLLLLSLSVPLLYDRSQVLQEVSHATSIVWIVNKSKSTPTALDEVLFIASGIFVG